MRSLNKTDHELLLLLIQGETFKSAAVIIGSTVSTVSRQMRRMRKILDCATNFQLIALEVVNLMETSEEQFEAVMAPKTKAAAA